jgi:hypothetical protein
LQVDSEGAKGFCSHSWLHCVLSRRIHRAGVADEPVRLRVSPIGHLYREVVPNMHPAPRRISYFARESL